MKNELQIKENIRLENYTTIKVGGCSDYFAEPAEINEFVNLIEWARSSQLECLIIGAGSNTLIKNISFKKLTICTKKMNSIKVLSDAGIVCAASGASLPSLASSLAQNRCTGGEWTVGIPGTIGGAIFMNAGAGEQSISKHLISVKVIDPISLNIYEIDKKEINFDYRFSSFQQNNLLILEAKFYFKPDGKKKEIIQKTKRILERRKKLQPYHLPSFGSVFKNPPNNFAGKLIEDCGLKGLSIGGAEVSNMHANFIVNNSSATSEEIFKLILLIQQKVLEKKGIFLHPEVRMIGF